MKQDASFHSHRTFADFVATDDELLVFRRFKNLNARSLLYLQSELMTLEAELRVYDEEDAADGSMEVMLSAKCWETLAERANEYPREAKRLELIRRIQQVTKQYNEALILQAQVLKIRQPGGRVWAVLSNWFHSAKPLVGDSRDLLDDRTDFAALKATSEQDQLSQTLEHWVGVVLALFKSKSNAKDGTLYYSSTTVQHIVLVVSIVGATLLLEAAIVALYVVQDDRVQFGLIAIFTVAFAASLSLLSNARLSEMFGATAAYAAVLVVFLAGNLGGSGQGGDHSGASNSTV